MAERNAHGGRITTFYSFKGGVGRTMALANVAFLAAMNGMKVLVMDWDLEAPGLDFYFRGLSAPERARQVMNSRGVLDLAWAWRKRLLDAQEGTEVDDLLAEYADGVPFAACACSVLDEGRHEVGRLDIIGAGSKWIEDVEPLSYAEALARFSWTDFVDYYGGGLFIERLRNWAKSNYDLILVDSRTGFADVAGICTIQLPDAVALSFIYNRQNIEGIAEVARSIRAERGDAVVLRAVPMRTSRQGLLDEAEARSRATSALQRSGAFTAEAAKADIELLGIRAAQNVPFYESIAPFATIAARDDQLSLDYRKLAEAISGHPIQVVEIPPSWRESVNRRLEYRTVTVDYLNDLREADPQRLTDELERLLEGAGEVELYDGGVDREYLLALVDLAIDLEGIVFDEVPPDRLETLASRAIGLLRTRAEQDPIGWAEPYVVFLEQYEDIYDPAGDPDEAAHRLRHFDGLLQAATWSPSVMIRRAGYRRRLANMSAQRDPSAALALIDEAAEFLAGARRQGATAESADDVELLMQRATLLERLNRVAEAQATIEAVLSRIDGDIKPDRRRQAAAAHLSLLRLEQDPERAASHLERAMEDEFALVASPESLSRVVEVVGKSDNKARHALTVIRRLATTRPSRGRHSPALFFGRTIPFARDFVTASANLAGMAASKSRPETVAAIDGLMRANVTVLSLLIRRYEPLGIAKPLQKSAKALLGEVATLVQVGSILGVSSETISTLLASADAFERVLSRDSAG